MSSSSLDLNTAAAPSREPARDASPLTANGAPVVRLEQAAVRVGARTIWHDVSLDVRAGEFVAVLGPNGSGKSTLLKALLGLLPLSEGRASILGRPAHRGNRAVGYLPQRRVFDADVRIRGRDLVRLGLDGARWGVPVPLLRTLLGHGDAVREERRRVDEVIAIVGASDYANRPIGEMSGGEQQRLLIAQALVTRPRLLLLDEPLEGLDLPSQQIVSTIIRRVGKEEGITTLLVAHDVNPLLLYLDEVIYVARGRVLIGTPQEVITTETLSRVYGPRVEVLHTSDGRVLVVGPEEEGVSYHA